MIRTESDWRLAEALAIQCQHGDRAQIHIAERVGTLALAGDFAAVERWKQIAVALDGLIRESRH